MGHSRKQEIALKNLNRRMEKAARRRGENTREQRVRFLIVCEGKRTEPNYFRALIRDMSSVVLEETIEGEGCSTVSLVNRTNVIKQQLEWENNMSFDRVWVVFDKDDFNDFNDAIKLSKKLGFECAWTNEAFELWYILHFEYLDTGISRHDYIEIIEDIFRKKLNDKNYKYKKNDKGFYRLLKTYGREDLAKDFADRLRNNFSGVDYASHKPCTMVDRLVNELEKPEQFL